MRSEIVIISLLTLIIYIVTSLGVIINNFNKIHDKKRRPVFIMFAISVALFIACNPFVLQPGKVFGILFIILYAAQLFFSIAILSKLKTRVNEQEKRIFTFLIINIIATFLFLYLGLQLCFYHLIVIPFDGTTDLRSLGESLIPPSIDPKNIEKQKELFAKNCVFNLSYTMSKQKLLSGGIHNFKMDDKIKQRIIEVLNDVDNVDLINKMSDSEFQENICKLYFDVILEQREQDILDQRQQETSVQSNSSSTYLSQ